MRGSSATSADSWRIRRRPVAAPPAWTTRRARVAALEPEREPPVAVGVEAHAERGQVVDRGRRLVAEDPGGRLAHRAAAGGDRCRRGGARGCRRWPAPRRGRPGPSSWRTRPAAWPRRASRGRPRGPRTAPCRGRRRRRRRRRPGSRLGTPGGTVLADGRRARVPRASLLARARHRAASRAAGADRGDRARARGPRLARATSGCAPRRSPGRR